MQKADKATIDYVMQLGPRCRDCADNDGICPASNLPCEPDKARAAIAYVLEGVIYGLQYGFLKPN
jgi:hypothetical protein